MSIIHEENHSRLDARTLIFPILIAIGLLILFVRLWFLQVVDASNLMERATSTSSTTTKKMAPRGPIVDRKGRVLAGTRPKIIVTGVPRVIKKHPESMVRLSTLLGIPEETLRDKLAAGNWRPLVPTPLKIDAPIESATKIAENNSEMPGIDVDSISMRNYSDTVSFAHILGYVWSANEDDVKRIKKMGAKPADYVGKVGLEYVHERELMGTPGSDEMLVDEKRRPTRLIGRDAPLPGDKLVLSLDADLQKFALNKLGGRRGSVVAIQPSTGGVLCMASSPSYDTGIFSGGVSKDEYNHLLNDPAKPMVNRSIAASYAPGSTMKIVTTIASQLAGKFNPNRQIYCAGYYAMGKTRFKCLGTHGGISFRDAMARSCNAYFATLAVEAGPKYLREACKLVGLGNRTGIDLLGESKGIVPTAEWIKRWRKKDEWYPGDSVNFGVGQGELSTTPLQMACVASLVANRGKSYKPHFVSRRIPFKSNTPITTKPEILGEVKTTPEFWNILVGALTSVVESGTARGSKLADIPFAGKTGSAENRKNAETHSWFVCFAPIDNPKIAIAVLVENAGHGGDVAAPIASQVLHYYLTEAQRATPSNASAAARNDDTSVSVSAAKPRDRSSLRKR